MQAVAEPTDLSARDVLARYPVLREDHLRYLEKLGLIRPAATGAARHYGFRDLAVLRQTATGLSEGRTFRAVVRAVEAERHGQLAFDFRLEAEPARVLTLPVRSPGSHGEAGGPSQAEIGRAEALFAKASALDTGSDEQMEQAATLYRRALEADPFLVAALINLGNIHYARSRLAEALALYEQACQISPDFFEAHYNLANVLHDLGRLQEAADTYRAALDLDTAHPDAHFYLAVTLEKMGRSGEARPHWQSYQRLAPNGAWAALAREFTES